MKQIYLTNTLSKQKETFEPITPGSVSMYHCGPTVYWTQHIGNMRAMTITDLAHRMFLYNGYLVKLVRNYTDVGHLTGDNIGDADTGEDRMEKAAKRESITPEEIADKYIEIFNNDIVSLNTIPPAHATRATDYISDMIDMVQDLLDKGFAYVTPHAVYFNVKKFPTYTQLSGQKLDHLESGEGHGTVGDNDKHDAHDFALWFFRAGAHANALQTWESPFASSLVENGRGFPGWHIECSAMSKHHLGSTFDIHLGGVEHIPIHHTNEIAQSECANGAHFVNYWLHNEHLLVDNKKMAKSEGTSYTLDDIRSRGFDPIDLRYFFLQSNYRSKQNFTWDGLEGSKTALGKLRSFLGRIKEDGDISESYQTLFTDMINDDLNTAGSLAVVWELIKNPDVSDADKKATILDFDRVLGLKLDEVSTDEETFEIPEHVQKLLKEREIAREKQDWHTSDLIRNEIQALGFELKDTDDGQKVRKV
jgi:cysteinyl-tRNA synthetase